VKFHSRGDKIAILYDPGEWPKIDTGKDGQLIYTNGGLPQNGSLDLHLKQFEIDVDRFIPNKTFDGLAVIDFECWRPTFRQNFGDLKIYRDLTLLEVNKKHPSWSRDQVEAQAKIIFESAAINFVNRTILRARKLRPLARWGFYGFPHCFNRYRDYSQLERCPEQVEAENNKLMFMYQSTIYPSIYVTRNQTSTALTKFVNGKMGETNRIATMTGNKSLRKIAFIRYQYTDTMESMNKVSWREICWRN
jgi:hyaluronoglucosaminidase